MYFIKLMSYFLYKIQFSLGPLTKQGDVGKVPQLSMIIMMKGGHQKSDNRHVYTEYTVLSSLAQTHVQLYMGVVYSIKDEVYINWWQHLSQMKRKDKTVIDKPREKLMETIIYNSHKADQCQTTRFQLRSKKR